MKTALFIVNPISGVGKQQLIEKNIEQHLDTNAIEPKVVYTEFSGHAIEISKAAAGKYDIVVAIGGDGTVNEVAKGLVGSTTAMAIIPTGSGNGLARFLRIPLKIEAAIKTINKAHTKVIDTVKINDQQFVNVAGLGFDAHISHLFAKGTKRGFLSYIKLISKEFRSYQPKEYLITMNGQTYKGEWFMLSFANSSEFGNDAHIAPFAKIDDGILDVCMLKKFPFVAAPHLALRLFNRTMDQSKYTSIIQTKKLSVQQAGNNNIVGHIDGEAVFFEGKMDIEVVPHSLHVIVN